MSSKDPIAYTYEADAHCPACAIARFGADELGFVPESARDRNGNPIGAIFPWTEWYDYNSPEPETLACGTCGGIIDEVDGLPEELCPHDDIDDEPPERSRDDELESALEWRNPGNSEPYRSDFGRFTR